MHIQDAHTNYEAQKNIVAILELLVDEFGLKLILVEGSEGEAGLAYLRRYGPPENRLEVAEKYLKAGIISAEEYLDIVSDHPLILWGVEQQELYDRNVEAFLAAETLQGSLPGVLGAVRDAAEALRPHLSAPALTELDKQEQAFDRHELALADFAKLLDRLAAGERMSLATYPNLRRLLEVHRLEESVELAQVQQQQQALIGELSRSGPEEDLEDLVSKALGMKEGTVKPAEFYAMLERLASGAAVSLTPYPELAQYFRYMRESAGIEPAALSDELRQAADALRARLAVTPESRRLSAILEEVDLLGKLLDLRLSPEEYRRLERANLRDLRRAWEQFLNAQRSRYGLPAQTFYQLREIEEQLPTLRRFYVAAHERDEQLVKNAVAKLRETGAPLAALITGGFHSPRITQLLKDEGLSTVVLTPKVSGRTNEQLYRAVVRYKSGRGSFDEVMAIANGQGTDATK